MFRMHRKQRGFSLVSALFLIIIMALLAVGMVQILTTSQQGVSQELTSVRAYLGAQSAAQWGIYQARYAGGVGAQTLTFSAAGLSNISVNVNVQSLAIIGVNNYLVTASAQFGTTSDNEYSKRTIEVRVKL